MNIYKQSRDRKNTTNEDVFVYCRSQINLTVILRGGGSGSSLVRGEAQRAQLQPFSVRFINIIV